MLPKHRDSLFKKTSVLELKLMQKKAHDYASNTDVLSTFKVCGEIAKCSPEKILLIESTKKLARLSELLDGSKKPKNESLEDSIHDARNYLFLLLCQLYKN